MDKEDAMYTHNGILPNHKEQWNNAIYSNIDELSELSEVNHTEKNEYCMVPLTCGI